MSDQEEAAVEAIESTSSDDSVGIEDASVGSVVDNAVGGGEADPFFKYKFDDGEERVFGKPAELADFLRQSGYRKADVDALQEKVSKRSEYLQQKIRDYENKERTFNESYSKISQMDKFLQENPEVANRIAQEMKGRTGNKDSSVKQLLEAELKPYKQEFEELKQFKEQQRQDQERQRAYGRLKERYEDFDEKSVQGYLNSLKDIPEQDTMYALHELAYHALRGKNGMGEMERRAAMKPQSRPSVASAPSGNKQVDTKSMDEQQKAEYAARLLGMAE